MEATLQKLADESAIRELVARYSDAVTHLDARRAAATYADTGHVTIAGTQIEGRAAIEHGMRQSFAAFDLLQLIAHGGLITLAGDRASARWSTLEMTRRKGQSDLGIIFGRYEDELIRTDAGWRFAARTFSMAGRMQVAATKAQFDPQFFSAILSGTIA